MANLCHAMRVVTCRTHGRGMREQVLLSCIVSPGRSGEILGFLLECKEQSLKKKKAQKCEIVILHLGIQETQYGWDNEQIYSISDKFKHFSVQQSFQLNRTCK